MKIELEMTQKELEMLVGVKDFRWDDTELILGALNKKLNMTNSIITNWAVQTGRGKSWMQPDNIIMHTIKIETPIIY